MKTMNFDGTFLRLHPEAMRRLSLLSDFASLNKRNFHHPETANKLPINYHKMQANKTKVSVEFKKRLRQEYERLKKQQESQEKAIIDVTWTENR